ncbi:hypothetical protein CTAYLR_001728 [Chrysophaeum taylorii]|uniref:EGF domain-specific O-linked N-acetylglucosamine transferase n=1 Tax=Chrysophaeum taylorii TaxID=2483200 RepID=A0AAD7UG79_9STRA|nr:hypothetical protein CTAYLR_001728 [Chrysophaeum taylorii]
MALRGRWKHRVTLLHLGNQRPSVVVVIAAVSALLGAGSHKLLSSSSSSSSSSRSVVAPPPPVVRLVERQNGTLVALEEELRACRNKQCPGAFSRSKEWSECERKFGMGLAASYAASKEVWCEGKASLTCFRHAYEHNKKTGMFCEGRNLVIDFRKVGGSSSLSKASRYLSFGEGATTGECRKTRRWKAELLMPHAALQLRGLREAAPPAETVEEATTTYLMARDEDCENMFHSTADHLNAYLVGVVLGIDWRETQTVLWDRHPDGPFEELIRSSFSRGRLKRAADYPRGPVRFRRLVFHLESPAGIVFPKVAGPKGIMRCRGSALWAGFRDHVLDSFGVLRVDPPAVPTIVVSARRRTRAKNVGRVFADEQALVDVLRKGNAMRFEVLDLATLSFGDQIRKLRGANVLVGAHGAGLMHVIFLADEAVLLEIHPSYRLDRHFRLAARMAGKIYLPMRSTRPVTCRGSSDSIPVDPRDFEAALDAAVRLARSFDDGVAECGLRCDPRILALDPHIPADLRPPNPNPLSTKFPCH